ncbi:MULTISPECIES: tripartite tricarboxylate transporter TctB family protein [unclassified Rhizobacter]|uniref:tripartite tricarboxylate transporter TctB family protein n=1 Tax=unclassified Rhizobacter TaxID=2640088 RepID=UPI0006FA910F|nr:MULTISPECIES: tripartite tricarboxylate transporter TctB family protein [unclassified Rhizobacter]KQU75651.1 tripartite tricarboxylate transporter TctB [Rhizobacter sp. Root29]KQW07408.1 tripartite tricarboxylate transporter TctB [Rhizobacter sp. Root1238]KRB18063.1 tripartite tricarboxylate transporter TctB [Rhizobacter sp. Root16D2]
MKKTSKRSEIGIGAGAIGLGALMAIGAAQIKGEAGYSGVGAGFLPWLMAAAMTLCGVLLIVQATTGGFRTMPEGSDDIPAPHWVGMAWLSAGLLLNAALITRVGFIPSCSLLFVLAARGFRLSMGAGPATLSDWVRDVLVGAALSAPVYWLFTKLLGLTLPGLTSSGWI